MSSCMHFISYIADVMVVDIIIILCTDTDVLTTIIIITVGHVHKL